VPPPPAFPDQLPSALLKHFLPLTLPPDLSVCTSSELRPSPPPPPSSTPLLAHHSPPQAIGVPSWLSPAWLHARGLHGIRQKASRGRSDERRPPSLWSGVSSPPLRSSAQRPSVPWGFPLRARRPNGPLWTRTSAPAVCQQLYVRQRMMMVLLSSSNPAVANISLPFSLFCSIFGLTFCFSRFGSQSSCLFFFSSSPLFLPLRSFRLRPHSIGRGHGPLADARPKPPPVRLPPPLLAPRCCGEDREDRRPRMPIGRLSPPRPRGPSPPRTLPDFLRTLALPPLGPRISLRFACR